HSSLFQNAMDLAHVTHRRGKMLENIEHGYHIKMILRKAHVFQFALTYLHAALRSHLHSPPRNLSSHRIPAVARRFLNQGTRTASYVEVMQSRLSPDAFVQNVKIFRDQRVAALREVIFISAGFSPVAGTDI